LRCWCGSKASSECASAAATLAEGITFSSFILSSSKAGSAGLEKHER
jgi:hypothetical protein